MRNIHSAVTLCCLVVIMSRIEAAQGPPGQAAQVRPNLSGAWTTAKGSFERSANTPEGLRIGPGQSSLIITQDPESMTVVERYSVFPDNRVVYRLNGQVVRNQFRLGLEMAPSEVTSRWQGNTLVSSIVVSVPGEAEPRRYQQMLSLNPSGFLLVRYEDSSSNARTITYQKRETRSSAGSVLSDDLPATRAAMPGHARDISQFP